MNEKLRLRIAQQGVYVLLLGVLSVAAGVWELREPAAGGQNPFSKPKKKEKRKKRR